MRVGLHEVHPVGSIGVGAGDLELAVGEFAAVVPDVDQGRVDAEVHRRDDVDRPAFRIDDPGLQRHALPHDDLHRRDLALLGNVDVREALRVDVLHANGLERRADVGLRCGLDGEQALAGQPRDREPAVGVGEDRVPQVVVAGVVGVVTRGLVDDRRARDGFCRPASTTRPGISRPFSRAKFTTSDLAPGGPAVLASPSRRDSRSRPWDRPS